MTRHRTCALLLSIGGTACLGPGRGATAQTSAPTPTVSGQATIVSVPDQAVLQALASNPVTAPYRIAVSWRNGQLALSGRVGSHVVHDAAVRLALAATTGVSIRDDLVIDTAESYRVAAYGPAASPYGMAPYVYPPPLMGRLDNPFYGFEPPPVSYPPWWGAVAAREPINPGLVNQAAPGPALPENTVEMTIDPRGNAVLRGTVPSLEARIAVGQRIAQAPGVREVVNLLTVATPRTNSETPPPPPQPAFPSTAKPPAGPLPQADRDQAASPPVVVDADPSRQRLEQALARRPALANLPPIRVTVRDGLAVLSGRVPSVYEAMVAYRAAEQTPGIRGVEDRLEFNVPEEDRPNPLIQKGRPEDVEPYLAAQIRRQVGDLAHVDQVRMLGDTLDVRGSLGREEDRPRLVAILRSMPVLRGFRVEPVFTIE